MKTKNSNFIILFLLLVFVLLFKYNTLISSSVINSSKLWFYNLVPSMLVMYLIVDLLLNYGFSNFLYRLFKSNIPLLVGLSFLLGTPANAKYIGEFYENGFISKEDASYLLIFAYSPNPLFILTIAKDIRLALYTLGTIYLSALLLALIYKKRKKSVHSLKSYPRIPFSQCLENSIKKTYNILILVLGIIIVYGIINSLIDKIFPNAGIFLKSILEMTNAMSAIMKLDAGMHKWIIFAATFGGLSIHTQIKSILESSDLPYKNFLKGRFIASLIALVVTFIL